MTDELVVTEEITVKIDVTKLTFGDLEMAMRFNEQQGVSVQELLPFLNRVIVGGVKDIPIVAWPKINEALVAAFESLGSSKN